MGSDGTPGKSTRQLRLRVQERVAADVSADVRSVAGSVTGYVFQRQQPMRSQRNRHEAGVLARVADLLVDELGQRRTVTLDAMEVVLRRLVAIETAEMGGNTKEAWDVASRMEEPQAVGPRSWYATALRDATLEARLRGAGRGKGGAVEDGDIAGGQ